MERLPPRGIDASGYILTLSDVDIQPEFEGLIADVCATLAQSTPLLDGIYLYGSVARGDATPGASDLDLTLVLRTPATLHDREALERNKSALERRHTEVTKIDFDIGSRSEVLAMENRLSWGYWLKHHCRCLWGNDLAERFEKFKPSRDIALAVNGDFESVLTRYAMQVEQAPTLKELQRLQREASRKLVRATHIFRSDQQPMWPQTLEDHVELFLQQYPSMSTQISYFLSQAKRPCAESNEFSTRLRQFLTWMAAEIT